MDKRSIESKVEKLEAVVDPGKVMVVCSGGVYSGQCFGNDIRLTEEQFKRWRETDGKGLQIVMVRLWGPKRDPATGQGVITMKIDEES